MDEFDKDKLKALPIKDRLEILQRIKEKKEKELKESEELILENLEDLESEDYQKKIQIPEINPVDISKLFVPVSDDESLEATLHGEIPEAQVKQVEYQVINDYEELREMAYQTLDTYQMERVDEIEQRMESAQTYKSISETISNVLDPAKSLSDNIKKYGT